jgi:probable HAF family extracellular repeat protein
MSLTRGPIILAFTILGGLEASPLAARAASGLAAAPPAAFSYTLLDLGTLGGSSSSAIGMNSTGQVVGYSQIAGDRTTHAFLSSGGVMHDLGTLGGSNSCAFDINDSGQAVGESDMATGAIHAFLYSSGVMHDLALWAARTATPTASMPWARSSAGRISPGMLQSTLFSSTVAD